MNDELFKLADKFIAQYTDELEYLDALRESGVTNMFGAAPYVESEFGVTRQRARDILSFWMATFAYRNLGDKEISNIPTEMIDRLGVDSASIVLNKEAAGE